eukprot:UN02026
MKALIDDDWSIHTMHPYFCGEPDGIWGPDNIGYMHGHGNLVIAEDTEARSGASNFGWVYNMADETLTPIVESVPEAEVAAPYQTTLNGWEYLTFGHQHPYARTQGEIPEGCDILGLNDECNGHPSTGNWLTYYRWPEYVDPCSCPEGTGYSSSDRACMVGSTTECYECHTMEGCMEGSCDIECYEFDPMKICQCSAGNCDDYGTCCENQSACPVDPCSCPEGTGYSSSDRACMVGSTTECYECHTMEGCMEGSCDIEC